MSVCFASSSIARWRDVSLRAGVLLGQSVDDRIYHVRRFVSSTANEIPNPHQPGQLTGRERSRGDPRLGIRIGTRQGAGCVLLMLFSHSFPARNNTGTDRTTANRATANLCDFHPTRRAASNTRSLSNNVGALWQQNTSAISAHHKLVLISQKCVLVAGTAPRNICCIASFVPDSRIHFGVAR